MKPLKLTMQAFGPYQRKTEIDFGAFDNQNVFLISGDTGSGKTMIFDALTYALYGENSGKGRSADMIRSNAADPALETFVELEFEVKGKTYKVRRSPAYERPKARGQGTTRQDKTASLEYPDGRPSLVRPAEVDQAVFEIIGLNRNQFGQVAMIAQNDFQSLLTAGTEERTKIFREIFQTEDYNELQNRLAVLAKEKAQALQVLEDKMEEALHSLSGLEMEVYEPERLEAWLQQTAVKLEELSKACAEVLEQIEAAARKEGRLKEQKNAWKNWKQAKDAVQLYEPQLKEVLQKIAENEKQRPAFEASQAQLVQLKKVLEKLDQLSRMQAEIMQARKAILQAEEQQEKLKQQSKQRETRLQNIKEELAALGSLELQLEQTEQKIRQIDDWNKICSRLGQQEKKTEQARLRAAAALENENRYHEEYILKNRAFLAGQAGILAQQLQPDIPCPVCGSLHHPHPAKKEQSVPSQDEVEAASQEYSEAQEEFRKLSSQLAAAREALSLVHQQHKQAWQNLPQNTSLEKEQASKTKLQGALQHRQQLEKEQEQLLKTQQQEEEKLQAAMQNRQTLLQTLSRLEGQLETLQKEAGYENREQVEKQIKQEEENIRLFQETCRKLEEERNRIFALLQKAYGVLDSYDEEPQDPGNQLQAVQEETDRLKKVQKAHEEQADLLKAQLTSNKTAYEKLEKGAKVLPQSRKELDRIKNLSETFNGTLSGSSHTKLETFVQAAYFERILKRANERLFTMSGQQYRLVRSKKEKGKTKAGLGLDVLDYYNSGIRSVKSLSGGESFMAALCLALGFSEEIQASSGGIGMDALFIDEGFATLDQAALDKAVSALQSLAQGKMVGIISHVESLIDQIENQIQVKKDPSSGSTITISAQS